MGRRQAQTTAVAAPDRAPREQAGETGGSRTRRPDSVLAVQHAVAILRCVSDAASPIGVNEIARRVGLHKSSVSRIVATLQRERLVIRDPLTDRIVPGVGLVALAAPALAMLDAKDVARPYLEELARRSGETISFSIWDGEHAVSVDQALGASAVRTFAAPGRRNPGHCTAAGKMLLAHAGASAIAAACGRPLIAHTTSTITDPARLRTELDETARRGYALNLGELETDVGAVSAAVRGHRGTVAGTITATVPLYRFASDRRAKLIAMVIDAANAVSAVLGAIPPAS